MVIGDSKVVGLGHGKGVGEIGRSREVDRFGNRDYIGLVQDSREVDGFNDGEGIVNFLNKRGVVEQEVQDVKDIDQVVACGGVVRVTQTDDGLNIGDRIILRYGIEHRDYVAQVRANSEVDGLEEFVSVSLVTIGAQGDRFGDREAVGEIPDVGLVQGIAEGDNVAQVVNRALHDAVQDGDYVALVRDNREVDGVGEDNQIAQVVAGAEVDAVNDYEGIVNFLDERGVVAEVIQDGNQIGEVRSRGEVDAVGQDRGFSVEGIRAQGGRFGDREDFAVSSRVDGADHHIRELQGEAVSVVGIGAEVDRVSDREGFGEAQGVGGREAVDQGEDFGVEGIDVNDIGFGQSEDFIVGDRVILRNGVGEDKGFAVVERINIVDGELNHIEGVNQVVADVDVEQEVGVIAVAVQDLVVFDGVVIGAEVDRIGDGQSIGQE